MRPRRLLGTLCGATALTITAALVTSTGAAWADAPLAPKTSFSMVVDPAAGTVAAPADGESIPNVDSVKSTIRAYYNATNGKANRTSSPYLTEVRKIEQQLLRSLPAVSAGTEAVTFDVDDTLLSNYDFEDSATNFNFDNTINGQWVAQHLFPAIAGMPQVLRTLASRGYELYGITGRGGAQEADTLANLAEQGFTADGTPGGAPLFTATTLYTKDATVTTAGAASIPTQPWVDCAADGTASSCSTVEYKALTRQHIASTENVPVVMNVGDQWSDLQGGYAEDYVKIPNPTYFLASPDLTNAPAGDAVMAPPTSYTMQPDGSSGTTVASGDDIPNIDPVRKMIRAYYNAPAGTADKATSPYISQLASLTSTWTSQVSADCTTKYAAHSAGAQKQAAVATAVHRAKKKVKKDVKAVAKAKKAVRTASGAKAKAAARRHLTQATKAVARSRAKLGKKRDRLAGTTVPDAPAVVLDADDTTLWNYDLEDGVMKFVYSPATAASWISEQRFPAVPGMVALVKAAANAGCAVFGLTGRPANQQADTVANLTKVGFVDAAGKPLFTSARYFTKDTAKQPWVDCGADRSCSTVEYKAGTRAHIEDQGFDLVGNFGDQYSDLIGGYADHVYKLPNPTYYLP